MPIVVGHVHGGGCLVMSGQGQLGCAVRKSIVFLPSSLPAHDFTPASIHKIADLLDVPPATRQAEFDSKMAG